MTRNAWRRLVVWGLGLAGAAACAGEDALALRAEHFTVPPATGPSIHVVVQNLRDAVWRGRVALRLPDGWRWDPAERAVALAPRATQRVAFTIVKGMNLDANRYAVEVAATGDDGARVVRKQEIVCASAPFFEPRIDGRTGDWDDAVPVTFLHAGKKTVVRTYWNRTHFCLLVEVEEERHVGYRKGAEFDAVQVAIAPREAPAASQPEGKAARDEFLLVGSRSMWSRDRCFLLATPGTALSATQEARELASLEFKAARLVVRRRGGATCYEAAIPLAAMPGIQPTEGREFCFSVLVHDPDGTGLRDWGEAAGLWPRQRNRLAWSQWLGARWGRDAPFDNRIEWGFCSSKH
ncbi:MAG TPA: NEW3 domain-containing protein [Planctomycetota bacterium]|nr:NEW3 domain-containing protein [Planctomycetota bacterium]